VVVEGFVAKRNEVMSQFLRQSRTSADNNIIKKIQEKKNEQKNGKVDPK